VPPAPPPAPSGNGLGYTGFVVSRNGEYVSTIRGHLDAEARLLGVVSEMMGPQVVDHIKEVMSRGIGTNPEEEAPRGNTRSNMLAYGERTRGLKCRWSF
jgi:hypothetical protein